MSLNALALVEQEGTRSTAFGDMPVFGISAAVIFPAALDDLREAGTISDFEHRLASTPHDQGMAEGAQFMQQRSVLLVQARNHFENRLFEQHGPGLVLHIRREREPSDWDERY